MHFFNPPALMKLVEVVATADSSEAALAATTEVGERMGRTPIRAKDSPGFIANRLARPFSLESLRMLADGVADAATIDRVLPPRRRLPDGPLRADRPDRARRQPQRRPLLLRPGRRARALAPEPDPGTRWSPKASSGARAASGFYSYGDGPPPRPTTPTSASRRRPSTPSELARIDPAAREILPRLVAQIANETAFALEEEVGSAADMDTAMRLGFNWPLGPLEFAELIGAGPAVALLERLRAEHGEAYAPAPRLATAATSGASGSELAPAGDGAHSGTQQGGCRRCRRCGR